VESEAVFGTVEAVKTVSDLFAPLSGKITAFNDELTSTPEVVNSDPYGAGWMVKIEMNNPDEINNLLNAEAYAELIKS
jgi:glycine cleavage system H protein